MRKKKTQNVNNDVNGYAVYRVYGEGWQEGERQGCFGERKMVWKKVWLGKRTFYSQQTADRYRQELLLAQRRRERKYTRFKKIVVVKEEIKVKKRTRR